MRRNQLGVCEDSITIWSAIDWLRSKQCQTKRRSYRCGHGGCERIEKVCDELTEYATGGTISNWREILKLANWQQCRDSKCNHRGCQDNRLYIQFFVSLSEKKLAA